MIEPLLRLLFSFALNSFVCFVAIRYMNRICGKRIVSNKLFHTVVVLGLLFTTIINNTHLTSYNIDLVAGASIIIFLIFLYTQRVRVKLLFAILFMVLAGVSQIVSVMAISMIIRKDWSTIFQSQSIVILMISVSCTLLFALCELATRFQRHKQNEISTKVSVLLFTIPAASLFMLLIIFNWYINNTTQTSTMLFMGITALVGILYINFIVCYLFDQISGLLRERKEKELLTKQVDMQAKHYQQLEEYQSKIRSIQHDIKNKLLTLNQIISEYGLEQAKGFISTMLDNISNAPKVIDTGNPAIDTILNIKLDEALRNNIEVITDIIVPQGLTLSFEQSAVLFGNLLDNSIEACKLLDDRKISIKMNMVNSALYLQISNTAIDPTQATQKADKLNHGIGLKNVSLLIKEFNGMMKIENDNRNFTVKIVLYDPQNQL